MRFRDSGHVKYWRTLEAIRGALHEDDSGFSALLGLRPDRFRSARARAGDLPAHSIFQLVNRVNVTFENFMKGQVDFGAVAAQRLDPASLPRRYAKGARSKRRNAITILEFVQNEHGSKAKEHILRHFQMSAQAFEDPGGLINAQFASDLCTHLHACGLTEAHFLRMGAVSARLNRQGPLGGVLSAERSVPRLYERVFADLIRHFDESFEYRLTRLSPDRAVVRVRERAEVCELMGVAHFGSAMGCIMRGGVGAALPLYLGAPIVPVRKLSCIHLGDADCRYEFDLRGCHSLH